MNRRPQLVALRLHERRRETRHPLGPQAPRHRLETAPFRTLNTATAARVLTQRRPCVLGIAHWIRRHRCVTSHLSSRPSMPRSPAHVKITLVYAFALFRCTITLAGAHSMPAAEQHELDVGTVSTQPTHLRSPQCPDRASSAATDDVSAAEPRRMGSAMAAVTPAQCHHSINASSHE